jgi:Tol biopolymer transport system component
MTNRLPAALVVLALLAACQPSSRTGCGSSTDYLGQAPPGDLPEVFARGIVSTSFLEHSSPAFSPNNDEVFWSVARRPESGEPNVIMTSRRENGVWTSPEVASFSGKHHDDGPCFSHDGKRLYFSSGRARYVEGERRMDIWFVDREGNGWSEPKNLGLVARFPFLVFTGQPSVSRDGTLYFTGYVDGRIGNFGIYCSRLVDGEYQEPQLLDNNINLRGTLNWTPFIASDESFLLFSSHRLSNDGDLFVSFRSSEGRWSAPEPFGAAVNTVMQQERFPFVSPDGRCLFFTRPTAEHSQDVFWMNASVIERLRP